MTRSRGFVRLAEPLRVGDRLSLAACWGSEPDLSLWLSIWTREGYARHCAAGPPVPGWCEDPETFP